MAPLLPFLPRVLRPPDAGAPGHEGDLCLVGHAWNRYIFVLKKHFFSQRYSNWIREKTRDVSQTWQVQKGEGKNSTNSNSVRYCYEIIRETGSEKTPKSFGTRISHQCVQTLWFCAKVAHFDLLLRIDFWVLSNEQENQKVAHLSLFKILCSKIKFLF